MIYCLCLQNLIIKHHIIRITDPLCLRDCIDCEMIYNHDDFLHETPMKGMHVSHIVSPL